MRAISAAQESVLSLNQRAVHLRVDIDRASGDWVDMTSLQGYNWCLGATIERSIDNSVATATVELHRQIYSFNLSPLYATSPLHTSGVITDVGNPIRVYTATVPLLTPLSAVQSGDWIKVFEGEIDEADIGATIKLRCRDKAGLIADRFIEDPRHYGTAPGDPAVQVETVMQDLLDDWGPGSTPPGGGTVTLYSPTGSGGTPFEAADSPGWAIKKVPYERISVLAALKTLSDQIGYDLRYKWQTNTSDFELVMGVPERDSPTSDRTFGPNDIYPVKSAVLSRQRVRNVVRVRYEDSNGVPTTVIDTDATSITKYGRRYFEITEGSTSQIDDSVEAEALRDAALKDLKEPSFDFNVMIPYFWPAELGDYYTFSAIEEIFNTSQSLAVTGIRDTIANGAGQTSLVMSGKPATAREVWLSREAVFTPVRVGTANLVQQTSRALTVPNGDFGDWGLG